jgi:hypothetical protein
VVTKKIATKKSYYMIFRLAPGKIRVVMLTFMGLVSAEIKQLQCAD